MAEVEHVIFSKKISKLFYISYQSIAYKAYDEDFLLKILIYMQRD